MSETTAITPVNRVKDALAEPKMSDQLRNSLPKHIDPERFKAAIITAVNLNPALQDIAKNSLGSLMIAASRAAQDGLMPDGRDAAFVIFGKQVQYMPMVAGILRKIRNSGELASIDAQVVYDHDQFDYALGDEPYIRHKPLLRGDRGDPLAVYAVARLKDGSVYREVMSVNEIEYIRSVSRAANNGPWVQWWSEMARKTAIKRLAKRLPMDTDTAEFFSRDNENDGIDFTTDVPAKPAQKERIKDKVLAAARRTPEAEPADVVDDANDEKLPPLSAMAQETIEGVTTELRKGTMTKPAALDFLANVGVSGKEADRIVEGALSGGEQ